MNMRAEIKRLNQQLDEAGYQFFEGASFHHNQGCRNVRLQRASDAADPVDSSIRTIRSCTSCGRSDVIKTFKIRRVGAPR